MTDNLTKEQRHRCMAAIKGKNTKPELLVNTLHHIYMKDRRNKDYEIPDENYVVVAAEYTVEYEE